ncbi:hypothetical protein E4656_07825 [Natronospirillum operosum]|uniref:Uncharacterized protein n=1 Tax=Natronospirillum operosum TaxID=2759953 RepID=A0A4Z0W920_9GAMM|nr:hypothetical protein [Natronospirillum operosum]TGG94077.1 hypothetical protein E4656_07825 [Natronospirillum operosum]
MNKRRNWILVIVIIAASTFGAGTLVGQEGSQQRPMGGQGMMEMQDMMNDMNAMMERCNAMMDMMQQGHESDRH